MNDLLQWYELSIENIDFDSRQILENHLCEIITPNAIGSIALYQSGLSPYKEYRVFIYTDSVEYLDKIKEHYSVSDCNQPSEELFEIMSKINIE